MQSSPELHSKAAFYVIQAKRTGSGGRKRIIMQATIKDISQAAGVSISTVSRVLNGSGPTSMKTREKVLQAVRELDYIPNQNARNLKLTKTNTILVIVKSISNPFFQSILSILQTKIAVAGYSMNLINISSGDNELEEAKIHASGTPYKAVLVVGGKCNHTKEEFASIGIPCVTLTVRAGEEVDDSLYSSIVINDREIMQKVVEFLISLGHTRIGFIGTRPDAEDITPNTLRELGYRDAMAEHGIEVEPQMEQILHAGPSGFGFGYESAKKLITAYPDLTAICTESDVLAVGAAKALIQNGLMPGKDITLTGFDGTAMAQYYEPAIATIVQPVEQMAQETSDALVEIIKFGRTRHTVCQCSFAMHETIQRPEDLKRNTKLRKKA